MCRHAWWWNPLGPSQLLEIAIYEFLVIINPVMLEIDLVPVPYSHHDQSLIAMRPFYLLPWPLAKDWRLQTDRIEGATFFSAGKPFPTDVEGSQPGRVAKLF